MRASLNNNRKRHEKKGNTTTTRLKTTRLKTTSSVISHVFHFSKCSEKWLPYQLCPFMRSFILSINLISCLSTVQRISSRDQYLTRSFAMSTAITATCSLSPYVEISFCITPVKSSFSVSRMTRKSSAK